MATKAKFDTVGVRFDKPEPVGDEVPPTMSLVFFHAGSDGVEYHYGPFLYVEDLPLERNVNGLRGLFATHAGGTELIATRHPDDGVGGGWRIYVEPISGTWDVRFQPSAQR